MIDHYPFEMFRARSAGGNVARILPEGIMPGKDAEVHTTNALDAKTHPRDGDEAEVSEFRRNASRPESNVGEAKEFFWRCYFAVT